MQVSTILKLAAVGLAAFGLKKWYDNTQEAFGTDDFEETIEQMARDVVDLVATAKEEIALDNN